MKLTKEKHVTPYYQLNVTYDELNTIYHSLGNYVEILNSLMQQHIGLRMTSGENKLLKSADTLCKLLRDLEPDLYNDLSFEDDYIFDDDDFIDDLPFA